MNSSVFTTISTSFSIRESLGGLYKIFLYLVLGSLFSQLAMDSFTQGGQLIALLWLVAAILMFISATGYLVICIVGRLLRAIDPELPALDGKSADQTQDKPASLKQALVGVLSFVFFGALFSFGAWELVGAFAKSFL